MTCDLQFKSLDFILGMCLRRSCLSLSNRAIASLSKINGLVFVLGDESVFCELETGFLNTISVNCKQ